MVVVMFVPFVMMLLVFVLFVMLLMLMFFMMRLLVMVPLMIVTFFSVPRHRLSPVVSAWEATTDSDPHSTVNNC
jgi:hypothetical protein